MSPFIAPLYCPIARWQSCFPGNSLRPGAHHRPGRCSGSIWRLSPLSYSFGAGRGRLACRLRAERPQAQRRRTALPYRSVHGRHPFEEVPPVTIIPPPARTWPQEESCPSCREAAGKGRSFWLSWTAITDPFYPLFPTGQSVAKTVTCPSPVPPFLTRDAFQQLLARRKAEDFAISKVLSPFSTGC